MTSPVNEDNADRFRRAISALDAANAQDPTVVRQGTQDWPKELLYAEWVTKWVRRLKPDASEALLLAARGQHLCRWMVPRQSYEMTRGGYLRWREDLKKFHALRVSEVLRNAGYDDALMARVRSLNLKENRTTNPECQTLEDALCLVTLEYQLDELIAKNAPEKMVGILQRTWAKMSPPAHAEALQLSYSQTAQLLLAQALQPASQGMPDPIAQPK